MERKIYKVMVDGNVSDYIQGRISGMIYATCSEEQNFAHVAVCDEAVSFWHRPKITAWIFTMNATEDEYQKIKSAIERSYPNLCTFYKQKG